MTLVSLVTLTALSLLPGFQEETEWSVLKPKKMTSDAKATFEVMPDGSIFVGGEKGDRDSYILEFGCDLETITGFKLEVIPDERLTAGGPGRAGQGNFVLSNLSLEAGRARARKLFPIKLKNATASFSQNVKHVSGLIDGNLASGWSTFPQMGKRNVSVAEAATDLSQKQGHRLRFRLDFNYGGGHNLGRFRISATDSRKPLRAEGSPEMAAWTEIQMSVDGAVSRAVDYLLDTQELDGSWGFMQNTYLTGQTGLCVYALLKAGVPASHPAIRRAARYLRTHDSHKTYALSCHLIALCTLAEKEDRDQIQELLDRLLSWQIKGGFAYPGGGLDLSNSQYAALAMRTAAESGFKVPDTTWRRLAEFTLKHKEEVKNPYGPAGYSYHGNSTPSGSMTAAGVSILAICKEQMSRRSGEVSNGIEQGVSWLAKHFEVKNNAKPGHGNQNRYLQYYLYGLERVGSLLSLTMMGDNNWYREGSRFLVESQNKDGSWSAPAYIEKQPNTCFGVLFLSRATAAATGRKTPTRTLGGDDPERDVSLRGSGDTPLILWVSSFGRRVLDECVWPGETTPRVSNVRYYFVSDASVDEPVLMAEIEGNGSQSAGVNRFATEYSFLRPGVYQVMAEVTLRLPDEAGEADTKLISQTIPARITSAPDPMLHRYAADSSDNVLKKTRVLARSSSHLHDPSLAVDNLQSRGWFSKDQDPTPTLVLDLEDSVRANTILFSHYSTTDEARNSRPIKVTVELNRKVTYEVQIDPHPLRKTEFSLPKTVPIRRLTIQVVERSFPNAEKNGVGFAEIELQLRTNR